MKKPKQQTSSPNHAESPNAPSEIFRQWAHWFSGVTGSPWAFSSALLLILAWAVTGPMFHFSDTWQLVINTTTTIITFLMVFLIQNTQNRDTKAVHLKLDELLCSLKGARKELVDLEDLSDEDLKKLQKHFERIHERSEQKNRNHHYSLRRQNRTAHS